MSQINLIAFGNSNFLRKIKDKFQQDNIILLNTYSNITEDALSFIESNLRKNNVDLFYFCSTPKKNILRYKSLFNLIPSIIEKPLKFSDIEFKNKFLLNLSLCNFQYLVDERYLYLKKKFEKIDKLIIEIGGPSNNKSFLDPISDWIHHPLLIALDLVSNLSNQYTIIKYEIDQDDQNVNLILDLFSMNIKIRIICGNNFINKKLKITINDSCFYFYKNYLIDESNNILKYEKFSDRMINKMFFEYLNMKKNKIVNYQNKMFLVDKIYNDIVLKLNLDKNEYTIINN